MMTRPWGLEPVVRQNIMVEAIYLMAIRKQKERGRGQGLNIPFKKGTRPMLHLLEVPPPPSGTTGWGASLQHVGLWGHSSSRRQQDG